MVPPFVIAFVVRPAAALVTTSTVVPAIFVVLNVPAKFSNALAASFSVMPVPALAVTRRGVAIDEPFACEMSKPLFNVRFRAPNARGPATDNAPELAVPKVRLVTPVPSRLANSPERMSSLPAISTASVLPRRIGRPAEIGAMEIVCVPAPTIASISIRSEFKTRFGALSAPFTVRSRFAPSVIVRLLPAVTAPVVTVDVSEINVTSAAVAETSPAVVSSAPLACRVTFPAVEVTAPPVVIVLVVDTSEMSPADDNVPVVVTAPLAVTTSCPLIVETTPN